MNTQPLNLKALGLTFLTYIMSTVILAIVLSGYWQSGIDVSQYTHEQLIEMAASSPLITIGSALIGATVAVICAAMITIKTGNKGYKHALYFALGLMLYGALGIVLHPEHHLIEQIGKLVTPIPLCLLGAWLVRVRSGSAVKNTALPNT